MKGIAQQQKPNYRILEVSDNFYPQKRESILFFWSIWKRIGVHKHGFGLYDYLDYPLNSASDAQVVIDRYIDWDNQINKKPIIHNYKVKG